ncbi:MAG: HupE/UreJ family protein [Deltaproteobacteria bacterium]|nr:HupE/UreJ family protein [Deltaproteobacteria bacterium]
MLTLLGTLAVLALPERAGAHLGSISYSDIDVTAGSVVWRLKYAAHLTPGLPAGRSVPPARAALLELQDDIERWLGQSIEVRSAGGRCQAAVENLIGPDAKDDLQVLAVWKCPNDPITSLRIVFHAFEARLGDWQNIASVRFDGKEYSTVFTPTSTRLFLGDASDAVEAGATAANAGSQACGGAAGPGCAAGPGAFFALGLRQIAMNHDPLLVLLVALIAGGSLARLFSIVASFTLAHSLTLVLAALGLVTVPAAVAQAAIALTIVPLAVGSSRGFRQLLSTGRSREEASGRRRAAITFAAGLLCGFVFAAALAQGGFARSDGAPALLAFHAGVEVGQIAVLAILIPAVQALARSEGAERYRRAVALPVGLVGLALATARILALLR